MNNWLFLTFFAMYNFEVRVIKYVKAMYLEASV